MRCAILDDSFSSEASTSGVPSLDALDYPRAGVRISKPDIYKYTLVKGSRWAKLFKANV